MKTLRANDHILQDIEAAGMVAFRRSNSVNLWAIRHRCPDPLNMPPLSDKFDDILGMTVYLKDGLAVTRIMKCTTDPGPSYLDRARWPNPDGLAILKPGQYRSAYMPGHHRGRPALVQQGDNPVTCWRLNTHGMRVADKTKARVYSPEAPLHGWRPPREYTGWMALNIHECDDTNPQTIGPWSAGCIVTSDTKGLDEVLLQVQLQWHSGMGEQVSLALLVSGQVDPPLYAEMRNLLDMGPDQ